MQPVGGVTPATGMSAGCGCPNVIADEVNYPTGNYLLASCQPYAGQLPGYQSVYDPLATVVQPSDAVSTAAPAPVAPETPETTAPVVPETPEAPAPVMPETPAVVDEATKAAYAQRRRMRQEPGMMSRFTRTLDDLRSRMGLGQVGAAAQLGPITIPTSVEEVTQPFSKLAENLGLTTPQVGGAEVQIGPVTVPTTMEELGQSMESLRKNITGGVGHRGDPRLVRRRSMGGRGMRGRGGPFLGAQVGETNTMRNVLLLLLALAVVGGIVVGFMWNRKNLKGKLTKLREDMMRRQ